MHSRGKAMPSHLFVCESVCLSVDKKITLQVR